MLNLQWMTSAASDCANGHGIIGIVGVTRNPPFQIISDLDLSEYVKWIYEKWQILSSLTFTSFTLFRRSVLARDIQL